MRWLNHIRFLLFLGVLILSQEIDAQEILEQSWKANPNDTSYSEIINSLESTFDLTFVYSSNILDPDFFYGKSNEVSLTKLFLEIFTNQEIGFEVVRNRRVLLYRIASSDIEISGVIRDSITKESIPSVAIYILGSNEYISSTDEGYFYLNKKNVDNLELVFSSPTYASKRIIKVESSNKIVVELSPNMDGPIIVIRPLDTMDLKFSPFSRIQEIDQLSFSPLGLSEELEAVKNQIMVQKGSEAQTGFSVKGGSQDQNLVLLDGMPIYDSSHIGGISSILISSAVKSSEFYPGNMPAEYGGRLSSVF